MIERTRQATSPSLLWVPAVVSFVLRYLLVMFAVVVAGDAVVPLVAEDLQFPGFSEYATEIRLHTLAIFLIIFLNGLSKCI